MRKNSSGSLAEGVTRKPISEREKYSTHYSTVLLRMSESYTEYTATAEGGRDFIFDSFTTHYRRASHVELKA